MFKKCSICSTRKTATRDGISRAVELPGVAVAELFQLRRHAAVLLLQLPVIFSRPFAYFAGNDSVIGGRGEHKDSVARLRGLDSVLGTGFRGFAPPATYCRPLRGLEQSSAQTVRPVRPAPPCLFHLMGFSRPFGNPQPVPPQTTGPRATDLFPSRWTSSRRAVWYAFLCLTP